MSVGHLPASAVGGGLGGLGVLGWCFLFGLWLVEAVVLDGVSYLDVWRHAGDVVGVHDAF